MKKILHIARNELYTLFYSPIAWIMMILFLVLTSADYIGVTDMLMGMFQRGGPNLMMTDDLTNTTMAHPMIGYLYKVIRNLYMFFPLITMGLISRETSSGTIKLLYSSPVKITHIVLGKYLAILVFTVCLIILLGFTLIALALSVSNPDITQMFASAFGIFLVLSTYAAIGLFISSLTSYQIVAAIITLGVFALLGQIGELWQEVDLVRNITYYMNIGGKSYNFIRGLMNLRDFMYFMILIGSFLAFTIIKIKSGTESISKAKKALRYITVIVIGFIIGYITNKPSVNAYVDTTRNQLHTITPPTQAMLAKLNDGELEITVFGNLLNMFFPFYFPPKEQNNITTNIWEPYIRFKPDIKMKFVYYYDQDTSSYYFKNNPGKTLKEIAEKEAATLRMPLSRFMGPEEVNKLVNTKQEEYRNFFMLKYKGKTAIVRTFDDNDFWPFENEIAAGINRLIATPPKVTFLSDEIERGPFSSRTRDYKLIASQVGNRMALLNQGYDFDTLSLKTGANIPSTIATLVIADPRTPISPENMEKISNYINGGGNLFVAGEPDRRDITKPLFDKLGITIRDGLLIQPSQRFSSDMPFTYLTNTSKTISPQFERFLKNERKYWGDSLFRVALSGASVMDYQAKDGFTIEPLLTTDANKSWNRTAPIVSDSLQLPVAKIPSDQPGSFVTAVKLSRKINGKDQRIVAASDADYLSEPVLRGGNPTRYNYTFGFWCFSYFSYGQFPANTLRAECLDGSYKVTVDSIPTQKLILYWIIPAIIAIVASVILIRRKRK